MMTRALLLLLLLLGGCAPGASYDTRGLPFPRLLYVSQDTSPQELELISTHLELWNSFVGWTVFELRVAADLRTTGCAVRVEVADDLGAVGEAVIAGQFRTHPGRCWARLLLRRDRLDTVAPTHELGHALGLGDTTDPDDVMCGHRQPGPQTLQPYVRTYLAALREEP